MLNTSFTLNILHTLKVVEIYVLLILLTFVSYAYYKYIFYSDARKLSKKFLQTQATNNL